MRVAIMQPYFFPYSGYFQLMSSVDLFIYLDDVQFVRRSWMTRNKISDPSGLAQIYLNVPVKKAHRSATIKEIEVFGPWVDRHKKTFLHVYGKKVERNPFYGFYGSLDEYVNLNEMLIRSLGEVAGILGIRCDFVRSSELKSEGCSSERIISLCKSVGAKEYYNLPGGVELYDHDVFADHGLGLHFIDTSHQKKISVLESIFDESACNLRF